MTTVHSSPSTSSLHSNDDDDLNVYDSNDVYSHSNNSYGPQILSPSISTQSSHHSHSRNPSESSRRSSTKSRSHRRDSSTSTVTIPTGNRSRARAFSFLLDLPQPNLNQPEMIEEGIELNPFETSDYNDALQEESISSSGEEEDRMERAVMGAERRFSYLTPKFEALSRAEIIWMGISALAVGALSSTSILINVFGRVK